MSADAFMELTNILPPDLYLEKVAPELSLFRIRVFQEKQANYVTLSLDEKNRGIVTLRGVPAKHIDIVAEALYLGLEEGIKTGLHKGFDETFERDVQLPVSC